MSIDYLKKRNYVSKYVVFYINKLSSLNFNLIVLFRLLKYILFTLFLIHKTLPLNYIVINEVHHSHT